MFDHLSDNLKVRDFLAWTGETAFRIGWYCALVVRYVQRPERGKGISTRARGVKSLWAYLSKPYIQLNFYNREINILGER